MAMPDAGDAPGCVSTDPDEFGDQIRDLSGLHRVHPVAVARPRSAVDVATVLH